MANRLLVVLASTVFLVAAQQDFKEVTVSQGIVIRGSVQKGASTSSKKTIVSFKGIPYARPLNESNRFMPPEDLDRSHSSTLNAVQSRPCLQISPFDGEQMTGTEDCLTMDIYVQDWTANTRSRPVVVYLPGGHFQYGNSATFGPKHLLDNDLVLVIVNYRLGAYGFLSTEDDVSPGNYGLMDQQKALLWVKSNIKAFMGDPERITIFGHDSGAASIGLHMLNHKSKDVFKQAVLSGGSLLSPWAFRHRDARLHANQLGRALGCDTGSSSSLINCLRSKKPEDVVRETWKMKNITFLPVVDRWYTSRDPFVEEDPIKSLMEGKARPMPLLLGMTKDEGSIDFFNYYDQIKGETLQPIGALTRYFAPYLYPEMVFNWTLPVWKRHRLEAIAKGVMFVYFKNILATDWNKSKKNWTEAISDFQYRSGIEMFGRLVNNHTLNNTYMYQFEFTGPYSFGKLVKNGHATPDEYGTAHMDDAFYFFDTTYDSSLATQSNSQMTTAVNTFRNNFKQFLFRFASDGHFGSLVMQSAPSKWIGYGSTETVMRLKREGQSVRCETEHRFRTNQLHFFSSFVKDMMVDDSSHVYYEEQETNQHYKSATWGLLGFVIVLVLVLVVLAAVYFINKNHRSKEAKFRRLGTSPPNDTQEMKRV